MYTVSKTKKGRWITEYDTLLTFIVVDEYVRLISNPDWKVLSVWNFPNWYEIPWSYFNILRFSPFQPADYENMEKADIMDMTVAFLTKVTQQDRVNRLLPGGVKVTPTASGLRRPLRPLDMNRPNPQIHIPPNALHARLHRRVERAPNPMIETFHGLPPQRTQSHDRPDETAVKRNIFKEGGSRSPRKYRQQLACRHLRRSPTKCFKPLRLIGLSPQKQNKLSSVHIGDIGETSPGLLMIASSRAHKDATSSHDVQKFNTTTGKHSSSCWRPWWLTLLFHKWWRHEAEMCSIFPTRCKGNPPTDDRWIPLTQGQQYGNMMFICGGPELHEL